MSVDTLLTQRLVLGALRRTDAAAMRDYEMRNRQRFAPHGPQRTDADFLPLACVARVEAQMRDLEAGSSSRWLIRLRTAPEAVAAMIGHAFETLNLHRVEAAHRAENIASARVLTKQGFAREGFAHHYLRLDGVWVDQVLNGLCNPQWMAER